MNWRPMKFLNDVLNAILYAGATVSERMSRPFLTIETRTTRGDEETTESFPLYASVRVAGEDIDVVFPAGTDVRALLTHLRCRHELKLRRDGDEG